MQVPTISINTLTTLALIFGSIQASKFIDFDNPTNVMILRVIYATSQALLFGALFTIKSKIDALPDSGKVGNTEQTIKEHDESEWKGKRKQLLITLAIVLFIHLYAQKPQPLFLQSILPWKLMIFSPLFQVHMLSKEPKGSLVRPWNPPKVSPPKTKEETTSIEKIENTADAEDTQKTTEDENQEEAEAEVQEVKTKKKSKKSKRVKKSA
eukprot:Phypoly_transcript_17883.p1 GENE.Phypoly_transcript_17883~~Phypoly_transcript_17883.p1  ORF type:complete len:210 (+),score=46.22 Phypoly_transcript_17883:149-778(+)